MLCCSGFTRARKAKFAVSCYFFSMGSALGAWAGVLPQVKKDHGLNNSILGATLVAAVFGAIAALPLVTYFSQKFGSGFSLFLGGLILLLLYPIVGIKSHLAVFVLGVFGLGFGCGWADVSMNAQAVVCEKMTRSSTLGLFHSIMAIGGLLGALFAGFLIEQNYSVLQVTIFLSLLLLFPQLFLSWWLYTIQEEKLIDQNCFIHNNMEYEKIDTEVNPLNTALFPAEADVPPEQDEPDAPLDWQEYKSPSSDQINYSILYSIAFLCFLSYFGQGSIGDWSAIYLSNELEANAFECTFGFVGFELFVAIGTYYSDWFVMRFGRKILLQASGIVAAIGLALAVGAMSIKSHESSLILAVVGFSLSGLGMSVVTSSSRFCFCPALKAFL